MCKKQAIAEREEAARKAEEQYGVISMSEWLALRAFAVSPMQLGEDLREDYEIGLDEHGKFVVHYEGECTACGFSFQFRHDECPSLKPGRIIYKGAG